MYHSFSLINNQRLVREKLFKLLDGFIICIKITEYPVHALLIGDCTFTPSDQLYI